MSDEVYNPAPIFYRTGAGLWLLGFCFALMPFEAYEAESFLLGVLCAVFSALCVLAAAPLQNLKGALRSPVAVLALGFWVLAFLSVCLSDIPFVSFIYFCFFSVFPLGFFAFVLHGGARAFFQIAAWGLAGVYVFLGLSSLVQYFFMPEMLFSGFVSWPLANPNSLGGLLSLGFFGSFGWMLAARGRVQSNIALGLAFILLVAVFTTGSRGAWLALLLALAVFMFFARGHVKKHKRCVSALLGFGGLSFLLMGVLASGGANSPAAMVGRTFEGTQPLLWARPEIWASALEIFKNHLWSGTGIGTFFLYYPEVRSVVDASSAGLMAHSDPLQFAAEMGVFAPLIFYAFIGFALVRSVRALKKLESGDEMRIFILVPFCGFAAMVVQAHISFPFHVLPVLMVAGLGLGFWFVQTGVALGQAYDSTLKEPHGHAPVRWGLAFPLLAFLGVFVSFQASEILVNRGQGAMMSGDMNAFADDINRAGRLSGNRNARALVAATHVPLGLLQLNAPFMRPEEVGALYAQVADLLERAQEGNPRLAQISYTRAELRSFAYVFLPDDGKNAGDDNAESYALRALALDPLHLGARVMLADFAARRGDAQGALDILKGGLAWRYRRQNPRFFLEKTMRFARELGDGAALQAAQREFSIYFPQEVP